MRAGLTSASALPDRGTWMLLLFAVAGVLAPTAAVLWFMNAAARSQEQVARQSVAEAYRGQARLLRDRVDAWWNARAAALDGAADLPAALEAGGADAAILLDSQGAPVYPAPAGTPTPDPTADRPDWENAQTLEHWRGRSAEAAEAWARIAASEKDPVLGARALQGQIRCLARENRESAVAAIDRFASGRFSRTRDRDGRDLAADELLFALHLLPPGDRRRDSFAQRLAARLVTYGESPVPSAQRLFLMDQLRAALPELPSFPTRDAELLAAHFLDVGRPRPGAPALAAAGIDGLWTLTSPRRRVLALYRTAGVIDATRRMLAAQGGASGAAFTIAPPGDASYPDAIPAGAALPGWQIAFTLADPEAIAVRHRRTAFLWAGYLVVAALILAGLVVGQSFLRQARLARLKTDLVAAVSHELKTPLASMRLLVDGLLEDGADDPVRTREYLELISGENLRLSRLIENFLTFSRIERRRQQFEFSPTSIPPVVETALQSMGGRLHTAGCRFDLEIAPSLPRIRADEDALVMVLVNLLDNACKYTPAEKHIRLRVAADAGCVTFSVADNGIGIAPRGRRRIFQKFYQVDRRLAREAGGCGLGLSIVESIVRAHGGAIDVQSRPGAGSTFTVSLPCAAAAAEREQATV
jgi:signal transduction histidine kinase